MRRVLIGIVAVLILAIVTGVGAVVYFVHSINLSSSADIAEGNDTWTWDGTNYVMSPPATRPPASEGAAMVYDPSRRYVLMYGGAQCVWGFLGGVDHCRALNQTWTWNGRTWTRRPTAHNPDSASGTLVFDAGLNRDIFVTGDGIGWNWDGTDWSRAWETTGLAPAVGRRTFGDGWTVAAGYDEARGLLVVLVVHLVLGTDLSSTWSDTTLGWDGSNWSQLQTATTSRHLKDGPFGAGDYPAPDEQYGVMPFDRDRHVLVALGEFETWLWDGTTWQSHGGGADTTDAAFFSRTLLYDSNRHRPLLLGSRLDGHHSVGIQAAYWWSGDTWSKLSARHAPYSDNPAVAFDDGHGVALLFGGRVDPLGGSAATAHTVEVRSAQK